MKKLDQTKRLLFNIAARIRNPHFGELADRRQFEQGRTEEDDSLREPIFKKKKIHYYTKLCFFFLPLLLHLIQQLFSVVLSVSSSN
jgi:hypothetical protein